MFRSQKNIDRAAAVALANTKYRVRKLEIELASIRRDRVQRERIKWGDYQKRLEKTIEHERGR